MPTVPENIVCSALTTPPVTSKNPLLSTKPGERDGTRVGSTPLDTPVISAAGISTSTNRISLTTPTPGATSYQVEYSANGTTNWQVLDSSVAPGEFPYNDTGQSASQTRYYRTIATDGTIDSDYSAVVSATTLASGGGGGSLANGQDLTITLSNAIGSIGTPQFSMHDDFDYSLSDGDPVPSGGGNKWEANGEGSNAGYSLDAGKAMPGRSFAATANANKAALYRPVITGAPLSAETFYWFQWQKNNQSLDNTTQPSSSGADKLVRIHDGDEVCGTRLSYEAKPFRRYSTHAGDYSQCLIDGSRNAPTPYEWDDYLGASPWEVADEWHLSEIEYLADGTVNQYLDGEKISVFTGMYHPAGMSNPLWQVGLAGYDAQSTNNLNSSFRNTMGEFACSGIVARIYFSNEPTYDDTVVQTRHPQFVVNWANPTVRVPKAYFGFINLNNPVYVTVIGNDGSLLAHEEMVVDTNVVIN